MSIEMGQVVAAQKVFESCGVRVPWLAVLVALEAAEEQLRERLEDQRAMELEAESPSAFSRGIVHGLDCALAALSTPEGGE